jgi:hypothetical protein
MEGVEITLKRNKRGAKSGMFSFTSYLIPQMGEEMT